jgi:methylmalonyl-CoA/ethylmalonyl-CoA epimerase
MKQDKVDHIGIAVPNLKEAVKLYSNLLGVSPDHEEEVAEQRIRTAFCKIGESHLELLEPTHSESPIAKFLQKRGGGIHHICIQVSNIEKRLEELKAKGLQLIDQKPRMGAHGKKVAFIHPKSTGGVLLELSEESLQPPSF